MSFNHGQEPLIQFACASHLANLAPEDVDRLIRQSWRSNIRSGVTGELRFDGQRIHQVLEGSYSVVMALAARILGDRRHRELEVLTFAEVSERRFTSWRVHGLTTGKQAAAAPGPFDGRVVVLRSSAERSKAARVEEPSFSRNKRADACPP